MPGANHAHDLSKARALQRGGKLVALFQQQIVQARAKNEVETYRGDKVILKSVCQPAAKRLSPSLVDQNYLHHYLAFHTAPNDLEARQRFLGAKLEGVRFPQWAGPWDTTITQVTSSTRLLPDIGSFFNTALCNIFSATLKPINSDGFLRGIRKRFKVSRYEVFTRGKAGLFRKDIPESLGINKIDSPEMEHKQGQSVFGSITLVCVHHRGHHTTHTVFSVARAPFIPSPIRPGSPCAAAAAGARALFPSRTCVSWTPGTSFSEVDEWWNDLISRPCLQLPAGSVSPVVAAALEEGAVKRGGRREEGSEEGPTWDVRLSEDHFEAQTAMAEGARVIEAALTPEFSDIKLHVCKPVDAVKVPPQQWSITDEELLASPEPSVASSEDNIDDDED